MLVHSGRQNLAEDVAAAIRRHQAGDPSAMEDLFRAVRPWLHGIGRACRLSIHSADDVVQNTMAVALTHLPGLRDPDAGLAWLSVIARREAIRISREERRTDPIGDREAWMGGGADPEEIALARLRRYRARAGHADRQHRPDPPARFAEGPHDREPGAGEGLRPFGVTNHGGGRANARLSRSRGHRCRPCFPSRRRDCRT
jgi:DNA-directed RNA polymerase specialized sigma24 family protein